MKRGTLVFPLLLVASGLIVISPTREARAATMYYVDANNGLNTNTGTDVDQPWQTLKFAMLKLHAGDTLNVRAGTYGEEPAFSHNYVFGAGTLNAGTPTARITVQAFESENVVVKARMTITNADYWTFDGLNIQGNPLIPMSSAEAGHLLAFVGGQGWIFRNAIVCCYNSFTIVNISGQAKGWHLTHNLIWKNDGTGGGGADQDHNIYVQADETSGPGFIERNVIAVAKDGTNIKLGRGPGKDQTYSPNAIYIRKNTLFDGNYNVRFVSGTRWSVLEGNILGEVDKPYNSWYQAVQAWCLYGTGNQAVKNLYFSHLTPLRHIDLTNEGLNLPPNPDPDVVYCDRTKVTPLSSALSYDPSLNSDPGFSVQYHSNANDYGSLTESSFIPTTNVGRDYGRFSQFDQVITGDWNGDNVDTPAGILGKSIFVTNRPEDNAPRSGEADYILDYESAPAEAKYIAGDWDGDNDDEVGYYVPSDSTFHLRTSMDLVAYGSPQPELTSFSFYANNPDQLPVAGDWDGNGRDEVGVYRPSTRMFYLRNNTLPGPQGPYPTFTISGTNDSGAIYRPVAGNWDGDSDDEVGLWEKDATDLTLTRRFHLRSNTDADALFTGTVTRFSIGTYTQRLRYFPVAGRWTLTQPNDTVGIVLWANWNRAMFNGPDYPPLYPVRAFDG